ncbi:putative periplasmic amino acid-binding protein (plasmid) [Nostoc carneum NIES-2107]|nr:putative periplasmic amino acid-binding protein [Nostoc carneum NIES-2107]
MHRRSWLRLVLLAVLMAVITISCGVLNRSSQTGEIIKVGGIVPLTGTAAYLGEGEKFGMQLALDEHPDMKSKINFVFEDSQGKPEVAVSAARKLLDFENVNIHTVSTTGATLSTLPIYKQSGKDILVFAQSMMPGLTKDYPFAFRIYATADEEMKLLADYAKKQKYLRIGTLNITNRAGDEAAKLLQQRISEYGGKIELQESLPSTEKDFRSVLTKFKQKNLDAIMVYAFTTTYPGVLQQMEETGLKTPVLANLQFAVGGFEKQVSPEILRQVVFPASRYYVEQNDPKIQEFNKKAKAAGKEANHDIAYFYDMTNILIAAIQKAQSSSPKAIGEAIMGLMPYEGVTGRIQLNSDRDNQAAMTLVRRTGQGIQALN